MSGDASGVNIHHLVVGRAYELLIALPGCPLSNPLTATVSDGRTTVTITVRCSADNPAAEEAFIPSPFQVAILAALEGRGLRTDALGDAVHDRSRVFRHPGGIKELKEVGLVKHHKRVGFYRPDAPPPDFHRTSTPG